MRLKIRKFSGFTPRTKKILEKASEEAKRLGSDYLGTEHILVGIIKETDSVAIRILLNLDANIKEIYEDILKVVNASSFEEGKQKSGVKQEATNSSRYAYFKSIWY